MGCEDAKCRCSGMVIIAPFTFISMSLYLAVIFILVKYRKTALNGAFFTLNISVGVADITSLIINDIFFKLPQYCAIIVVGNDFALANSEIFGKIVSFFFWYLNHVQLCGVVMITLNRYTALSMPMKHAKIWRGNRLLASVAVMWLLPFAFSLPIFATSVYFRAMYDNQTLAHYLYSFRDGTDEAIVYGFNAVYLGIVLNVTLLILYCAQFFKYWKHRREIRAISHISNSVLTASATKYRTEWKLAICGLMFFSVMSFYGIIALLMVFEALDFFRCHLCIHVHNIVGDMFCWINAYLLIMLSKSVRECFLKTFGIRHRCCRKERVHAEESKSKESNILR